MSMQTGSSMELVCNEYAMSVQYVMSVQWVSMQSVCNEYAMSM